MYDLEPYKCWKLRHSATACQKAEPNLSSPPCPLLKATHGVHWVKYYSVSIKADFTWDPGRFKKNKLFFNPLDYKKKAYLQNVLFLTEDRVAGN